VLEKYRIHKRKSYKKFREFADKYCMFVSANVLAQLLRDVFDFTNSSVAYGSAVNAGYAKESMEQVIKDLDLE